VYSTGSKRNVSRILVGNVIFFLFLFFSYSSSRLSYPNARDDKRKPSWHIYLTIPTRARWAVCTRVSPVSCLYFSHDNIEEEAFPRSRSPERKASSARCRIPACAHRSKNGSLLSRGYEECRFCWNNSSFLNVSRMCRRRVEFYLQHMQITRCRDMCVKVSHNVRRDPIAVNCMRVARPRNLCSASRVSSWRKRSFTICFRIKTRPNRFRGTSLRPFNRIGSQRRNSESARRTRCIKFDKRRVKETARWKI